jgi:small subunit ribosomal protein S3e
MRDINYSFIENVETNQSIFYNYSPSIHS